MEESSRVGETHLPLADVRVVAIEQFGAGPWGTLQLADLGAEVIKLEDPPSGGDVGRYVPPFQEGEDSLFFETFNRGKKSISLDLRNPAAREVFHDLVRRCDGVYSNLRGDQPARLGLTYDELKDVNPRIVCCSLSGFGMTGPRASEGGYDYMMQGLAGWQSLTGDPGGPPTKSGLSLVDLSGGYASAIALLAGIWRARRDGIGCDCDVSLFETALHELMYVGAWVATRGYVPPRRGSSAHPTIVPFQNFEAADGWLVVAAAKQKFWKRLCVVIGRPELDDDPRFATMAARNLHRDELVPVLEAVFRRRTVDEWVEALVAAGVPASRVNTVEEALADPQTVAREDVVSYEHPSLGRVRSIRTPLRLAQGSVSLERPPAQAPTRGEHTKDLLAEICGYSRERLRDLSAAGVFGDPAGPPGHPVTASTSGHGESAR
jgi:crotonobetainyl-CoA:carnitine CoA-transferase CaiB-like acyl-CoA transferase